MAGPGFLQALVSLGASFGIACLLIAPTCELLSRGGLTQENFRGDVIPNGVGLVVPLAAFLPIVLLGPSEVATLWLLLLFGVAMLGIVDDAAGSGEHGGFSAHVRSLARGKLTTGGVKAVFGGALALYAGWVVHGQALPAILSGGVIALCTNAVNLLDVRPGRAIKGALFLCVLGMAALFASASPVEWAWRSVVLALAPLGAALALLRGDLRAAFMIGDAGANVLGVTAGMIAAVLPYSRQAVLLAFLALVHAYAERGSLSSLIERRPLLKWFDDLGRG